MANELLEIPNYTAEDFTESTAPFDFLYEFSDNKFMLQQMIERMKIKAAAVGIKSFMKLWNSYVESMNSSTGTYMENVTDFERQPRPLKSGKYICNQNGVSIINDFRFSKEICPHPIMPIKRYKNVDTQEELLEVWFEREGDEKQIIIPKDDIANGLLKYAKYGILVNKRNEKDLAAYLQEIEQYNYKAIGEQKSVKRLGWVGDRDFSPYVEGLTFDGEADFGNTFYAVTSHGNFDTWIEAIKKVRAEKTAARYYIAASFASVILKPCGLLPFFVHTWGGSENGKTVALMIAASVWACPMLGEYVITFNGTRYAQETTAAFLKHLPLCLDELQIQVSQGVKDFDDIIYQLCEGVSKNQGKASGGLRQRLNWKNVILSNGEHTIIKPLSGGGARNRVIEIEAPEKMYSDLVGLCEIINENYGFAGKVFVDWLREDGNIDEIRKIQKDFYHKLLDTGGTDKQSASASAMLAADKIVTELIFKDGNALTVEDMEKVMLKKEDIDINARALEWLYDFVAANNNHFNPDNSNTEIWGEVDDGEDVIYFIRTIFNREFKANGLDATSFLSWAKRMGVLISENGRYDKQKRIPGTKGKPRCVCLKIMSTEENGENTEFSEDDDLPF